MKYLKLFEGFNKGDIDSICKEYGIENYTINDDGSIDVDGDVDLTYKRLKELPLKFRIVSGYFDCNDNDLTSLEGSPKSVGGGFWCYDNQLTTLEGSPKSVGGGFYCSFNQLKSLKGCPESVGGNFYCQYNKLTSLEGCPESVGGDFYCDNNQLTSLEGCPQSVGGDFYCNNNNDLTSLEGCPESVGGHFYCNNNKLTSLEGLGKVLFDIHHFNNPCFLIYNGWINDKEKRDVLLDLIDYYDFLRDNVIIWDRLLDFFEDSGLKIPNRKELEKYYKIIE